MVRKIQFVFSFFKDIDISRTTLVRKIQFVFSFFKDIDISRTKGGKSSLLLKSVHRKNKILKEKKKSQ